MRSAAAVAAVLSARAWGALERIGPLGDVGLLRSIIETSEA
ncbi:MAG TPA: hypothetical protein VMG12_44155 [Polyangiaceae bacterium]|nr:hypothetical protein [Polyangiaceae bacterium]